MQNVLTSPPLKSPEPEPNPMFNVLIAYEDFDTGKNAKRTYDFLVEHLGDDCTFSSQMWKFDVLALPKLKEMAAHDAAEADIIIVSAHGTNDVPAEVKSWIEEWLGQKPHAIALVGLFDPDAYLRNLPRSYLADVAKRGGMEFFAQPGFWPGDEKRSASGAADPERSGKTLSVLAEMVQRDKDVSHWENNE